jgi:hypothetical protein
MPKRSPATRGATQHQKQKSFELVRPETAIDSETSSTEVTKDVESEKSAVPAITSQSKEKQVVEKNSTDTKESVPSSSNTTTAKASASARLAARRQATLRAQQQRSASAMITPEHFAYVKRDLALIGTLAVVFFATIIVLYFVLL